MNFLFLGNNLSSCKMLFPREKINKIQYDYVCRWWKYWNSSFNTLNNVSLHWKSYCCVTFSVTLI